MEFLTWRKEMKSSIKQQTWCVVPMSKTHDDEGKGCKDKVDEMVRYHVCWKQMVQPTTVQLE